jgi:hypothetical protein
VFTRPAVFLAHGRPNGVPDNAALPHKDRWQARLQKMNRPIVEWACAKNNLGYKEFFELQ